MGMQIDYRTIIEKDRARAPRPTPAELRFLRAYITTIRVILLPWT